jgi:hypothetical protein
VGTRVVTYHGFGASPPSGYVRTSDERIGSGRLALWIKTEDTAGRRPRGDVANDEMALD